MVVTFEKLGAYGRMGNAMFQIAATIGYAKKYNDTFLFPKWEHQNQFNLPKNIFVEKHNIKCSNQYTESSFTYSEIPYKENCNLHGYFQSWKYFDHCREYIREIFTPAESEDPNLFRGICAVHVRRGDYLKFPDHHPTQDLQYYFRAMEHVSAKRFLIFSDDVKWCERNFVGNQFIVSAPASPETDLHMMSACESNIIANSSFSWWAAWLNDNPDKVVVAPKNWFGRKLVDTHPIDDLIPQEWILL
jgi:hypothetical protein